MPDIGGLDGMVMDFMVDMVITEIELLLQILDVQFMVIMGLPV